MRAALAVSVVPGGVGRPDGLDAVALDVENEEGVLEGLLAGLVGEVVGVHGRDLRWVGQARQERGERWRGEELWKHE